jgi:hypothetical protein
MSDVTVVDKWNEVALPILAYVSRTDFDYEHVTVGELAEAISVDVRSVATELRRLLEGGYLGGELAEYVVAPGGEGCWRMVGTRLTEKGSRAVGPWPPDELYQALVQVLDRQIESAADEGERSKLLRLKGVVRDMGVATMSGVLAELLASGVTPHLHI